MIKTINSIAFKCRCGCSYAQMCCFEHGSNIEETFIDWYYRSSNIPGLWQRIKNASSLLFGKEVYIHGVVISKKDVEELYKWMGKKLEQS